jgi:hypothetical protein
MERLKKRQKGTKKEKHELWMMVATDIRSGHPPRVTSDLYTKESNLGSNLGP